MQELYYSALDIAVIVSSMQLGCRDESRILDQIWEGEKAFLDTPYRANQRKFILDTYHWLQYFYDKPIIDREFPDAYRENLIVLDGTTGQNALAQAREFGEVANLTGIVLTKMDGTAKGGIAVAIQAELGIPVKYIGVGETIDDLQKFNSDDFVNALFKTEE